jgi:aryl-alcohol dehydrogenase-like predicted oxidoreductase
MDRRDFLRLGIGAAAAGAMGKASGQSQQIAQAQQTGQAQQSGASHQSDSRPASRPEAEAPLPVAALGKTGRVVPKLGIGCYPLSELQADFAATAIVRRALDLGVRYIDTAPSYGMGVSELRIGAAIHGYDRKDLYIATKTFERDASGARRDLEGSLRRLGVEYVDCMQVHEVHDDWETLFAKDSVLRGLEKARDEGLVRFIGITGHRDPKYVISAIERYPFATALVPVNPIDTQHLSFTLGFLPEAEKRGVAVVGMKLFAGGRLVSERRATARQCIAFAFSRPQVSVVVPGCNTIPEVEEAVAAVLAPPPDPPSLAALEIQVGRHRGQESEWYKDPKRR